jgi:long-chain acyl-CoA synthetase
MLGYWNHPEVTAAALRGGVLHTGDVGAVDRNGYLWVRDRRSDLIIRGGANVYPAEVERVLEATGLIAEAAVVGRDHSRLGEEVVAFVSAAPGVELDVQGLVSRCHAELAGYKVPSSWFVVAAFPRNAMGKVVKPQLRAWLAAKEDAPTLDVVARHEIRRSATTPSARLE